jgi:hypothetical protein
MPVLSVQTNRLRFTTYEAVQALVDSAKFRHEKEALQHVFNLARQKKTLTGFDFPAFQQAYTAYRNFKRSPECKSYQGPTAKNTRLHTFTHDEFHEEGFLS